MGRARRDSAAADRGPVAGRLERGAAGEVVAELESLVADHPLREGLWALLITALYRAARQADALAAYRRVREQLADELGIEPGAALGCWSSRCYQDPLLDAPASAPATTRGRAGHGVGRAPPRRSAARRTGWRSGAVAAEHRLVTLSGPPVWARPGWRWRLRGASDTRGGLARAAGPCRAGQIVGQRVADTLHATGWSRASLVVDCAGPTC